MNDSFPPSSPQTPSGEGLYPNIAPKQESVECKCCKGVSPFFSSIDFNRHCNVEHKPNLLSMAGVNVPYYRCQKCEFLFTSALDHLSSEELSRYIYNDQYELVDESYQGTRAEQQATTIASTMGAWKDISILDYGAGRGDLAVALQAHGFSDVTSYDPFVEEHSQKPTRRFDFVTCFEVFEHSFTPMSTVAEISRFLGPQGVLLFSTQLQPEVSREELANWWYLAPRNGHVSLHSANSLQVLADQHGFQTRSMGSGVHWFFSRIPSFARHILG